jgi:phospholipid/cholesterol/gamma-HCH transport system substrate-binding protein
MRNSLETRLGIFVALALIASLLVVEMVGGLEFFKRGYHVSALFNNIQDLKAGDSVKMAGYVVGRVDRTELTEGRVKVTMRLKSGTVVKTDSIATVRFTGLMGQNYVSIDFGSPTAKRLDPDQLIATAEQPDLNILMARLDNAAAGVENLTKNFTGDKIDNLFGPITDFLKQNSEPLHTGITNLANISGKIASGQGTVGHLIYSNDLYDAAFDTITNIQAAAGDLQTTIADARNIINDVNAGKGTIGKLVKDETLYNETTGSMTNLHQILLKINNGQGTIGKLVNDPEFYKNAKLSLQKLDKAADSLEDSGPMSVMGQAVGTLF